MNKTNEDTKRHIFWYKQKKQNDIYFGTEKQLYNI